MKRPLRAPLAFVTHGTGTLYSIDAITGVENWDLDLEPLLGLEASVRRDSSTIVDHDGDILFSDDNLGTIAITQGTILGEVIEGGDVTNP